MIEKFEDLIVWQKSRVLAREIYKWSSRDEISKDYPLKDQIRRSAVSIMANIAEGFDRYRPTEFHQFLSIAKGSCAELRSHLYVALDAGYLPSKEFDHLSGITKDISNLVGALRTSVAAHRDQAKV